MGRAGKKFEALLQGQRMTLEILNTLREKMKGEVIAVMSANPDMVQTDTATNHGNSGGPLLNMKGDVIGVCDMGLATVDFEGLNFAIPISTVKKVVPSLISNGLFDHPWLGIGCFRCLLAASKCITGSVTSTFKAILLNRRDIFHPSADGT